VLAIEEEMKAMKADVKTRQHGDAAMMKAIEDLKERVNQSSLPKKAGIKKLFSRRRTSSKAGDDYSVSSKWSQSVTTNPEQEEKEIVEAPSNQIATTLPPSMSLSTASKNLSSAAASSSDSSSPKSMKSAASKKQQAAGKTPLSSPVKMDRTLSKTHVQENGEVELEAITAQ